MPEVLAKKNSTGESGPNLLELLQEKKRRLNARSRLLPFCQYTDPNYIPAEHLKRLAEKLEAVERGEITRLIVVMPPQHGKSELISRRFPCWYLGRHPEDHIVQAGYAEGMALFHSRKARDIFVSSEMHNLFPQVYYRPERAAQEVIIPERQAAHEWGTKQQGSYYAVGVGGGLTGRGFNIGIIDDPVKDAADASSKTYRDNTWDWYTTVFHTRQRPRAAIIIVMTRWHHDDIVGRLLKHQEENPDSDRWEVLHLKAIENGKALWPERYPLETLEKIKSSIGSRAFESLYQGEPSIAVGEIFKREWWQYFDEPPDFQRVIHSWDTAFKKKQTNDFSVCTVWGEARNGYYLLNVWRGRVEFPELKTVAVAMFEKDKPSACLVEDLASGQSLIQELQRGTRLPVLPVKVDSDKITRASSVTPMIEAKKVFLPRNAPWLYDYLEELSSFPNGAFDDQVDSTTQALNWLRGGGEETVRVVYDSMQLVPGLEL